MAQPSPKILLLTTQPLSEIKTIWQNYQNTTLPQALRDRGALVSIECWMMLEVKTLASYDVVTFLWCNDYHLRPLEFPAFIRQKLVPAQQMNPQLRVINDCSVILWNINKIYLQDLDAAKFVVPKTEFVPDLSQFSTMEALGQHVGRVAGNRPVVLKPSISASSKRTYLVRDPSSMTAADRDYLAGILATGIDGCLMVQAFEPAIANGEYSLVFVAGEHTHTMVKIPVKGEFRCQSEFGGDAHEIRESEVPKKAKDTAEKIIQWMEENVGPVVYCRIDGVVKEDGEFVLMELEAIEPELWLDKANAHARDLLYRTVMGTGR